jgi:hypothetical protein
MEPSDPSSRQNPSSGTIITVEMEADDVKRLLTAFAEGKFADLGIKAIKVADQAKPEVSTPKPSRAAPGPTNDGPSGRAR